MEKTINSLKHEIDAHALTTPESTTRERILGKLEELLGKQPFDFERDAWRDAIITLADQYFILELESRYPRVAWGLFEIQTELEFECVRGSKRTYQTARVQVPVFHTLKFGDTHSKKVIKGFGEYKGYGEDLLKDELEWTLEVTSPHIPEEVRVKATEAEAFLHEVYAGALRERILRQTINLVRHTGNERKNIFDPSQARLDILWRPKPGEINFNLNLPPDRDPALVMEFREQNYVVTTWDVDRELSFRHYLKEFELPGLGMEGDGSPKAK